MYVTHNPNMTFHNSDDLKGHIFETAPTDWPETIIFVDPNNKPFIVYINIEQNHEYFKLLFKKFDNDEFITVD